MALHYRCIWSMVSIGADLVVMVTYVGNKGWCFVFLCLCSQDMLNMWCDVNREDEADISVMGLFGSPDFQMNICEWCWPVQTLELIYKVNSIKFTFTVNFSLILSLKFICFINSFIQGCIRMFLLLFLKLMIFLIVWWFLKCANRVSTLFCFFIILIIVVIIILSNVSFDIQCIYMKRLSLKCIFFKDWKIYMMKNISDISVPIDFVSNSNYFHCTVYTIFRPKKYIKCDGPAQSHLSFYQLTPDISVVIQLFTYFCMLV